jgi:hypothetical protein
MRTHGFGMMVELERDIVYQIYHCQTSDYPMIGDQNIENTGGRRPGKPILKL